MDQTSEEKASLLAHSVLDGRTSNLSFKNPKPQARFDILKTLGYIGLGILLLYTPTPSLKLPSLKLHACQHNTIEEIVVPIPTHGKAPKTPVWSACGLDNSFECSKVYVPMNYDDLEDERSFALSVIRMKAYDQEGRKGAIFFNPGGPGGSGTETIQSRGEIFMRLLQGKYDLISWDPRAVNETTPSLNCYSSALEHYLNDIAAPSQLSLPSNMSLINRGKLKSDVETMRAQAKAINVKCAEGMGDWMRYVGTRNVVLDIDWLATAINGPEEKINYWGFSYGTVIGQYLAAILPASRLGKVIIDGVVDTIGWIDYGENLIYQGLDDIDHLYDSFSTTCIEAGPENCALAKHFSEPYQILGAIDSMLDSLYLHPRPSPNSTDPSLVITAGHLKQFLFRLGYSSPAWKKGAEILEKVLIRENFEGPSNLVPQSTTPSKRSQKLPYVKPSPTLVENFSMASKTLLTTRSVLRSRFPFLMYGLASAQTMTGNARSDPSGCLANSSAVIFCSIQGYLGASSFVIEDGSMDYKMLVMSNKYDPVTPLWHAEQAFGFWGDNARLIEQIDGTGHCTLNQASLCTAKILREYWVNDTAPFEPYTPCKVDQKPFYDYSATILEALGEAEDRNSEDQELMKIMLDLSEKHKADAWEWGMWR